MDSSSKTSIKRYPAWPTHLAVVLGYLFLVVVWSALLLATDWPIAVMPVIAIPTVLAVLYHLPRPVYLSMSFILIIASLVVAYYTDSDFGPLLGAVLVSGISLITFLELIRRLVNARKQVEEELQQRNRELAALNAVTATITATLELDQVFRRLVNTIHELFPQASSATLQLLDESDKLLRTQAASAGAVPVSKKITFHPGEGIAGLALKERRPINVTDVTTDPRYVPGPVAPSYRSLLVAPLIIGQRTWGTLSVAGAEIGAFRKRDERLIARLSQQAAIAVENAQLYAETRRRLAEMTVLQTVSAATETLDLDQLLCQTVQALHRLRGIERLAVVLPDEATGVLRQRPGSSVGFEGNVKGALLEIPIDHSISGQVYRSGQSVLLTDVSSAPNYYAVADDTRSELTVPLTSGHHIIGVLNAESPRPAAFDENDQRLFETVAAQLAVALENARLFGRVRAAEAQYRGLFEGSADPIAITDTQGRILDVNPATCRISGRSKEELRGQSARTIGEIPEPTFRQAIDQALEGEAYTYAFSTVVSGKTCHFQARLERIDYGDSVALQWVAHDVTARRELDQWREELSGITIHNLRNPLTLVKSGTEAARMYLPEGTDPDVLRALEKAIKGSLRLEQQIDVLLNINRTEAGQELTDRELLSPSTLVTEVLELLRPRAAARRVELRAELSDSLPNVWGNRNMLAWTLENLVENAIKFSPPDQTVTVRAALVQPPTAAPQGQGAMLRISVSDRGSGVPPCERERIFLKFYQVRRPQKTKGSGMGLYFCKLAVEAHGGDIWVEDNPEGKGSLFSFTLPL